MSNCFIFHIVSYFIQGNCLHFIFHTRQLFTFDVSYTAIVYISYFIHTQLFTVHISYFNCLYFVLNNCFKFHIFYFNCLYFVFNNCFKINISYLNCLCFVFHNGLHFIFHKHPTVHSTFHISYIGTEFHIPAPCRVWQNFLWFFWFGSLWSGGMVWFLLVWYGWVASHLVWFVSSDLVCFGILMSVMYWYTHVSFVWNSSGLVWFGFLWSGLVSTFTAAGNCLHLIFPPPPSALGSWPNATVIDCTNMSGQLLPNQYDSHFHEYMPI